MKINLYEAIKILNEIFEEFSLIKFYKCDNYESISYQLIYKIIN